MLVEKILFQVAPGDHPSYSECPHILIWEVVLTAKKRRSTFEFAFKCIHLIK
jgi:hypothetical protein